MRKRVVLSLGVAALAIVVLAGVAAVYARAQGGGRGWRGGRPSIERIVDRVGRRLDLTADQKTQVNSILTAERANVEPLFAQFATNWRQMRETTKGGQFDEAQVRAVADSQARTVAEMIVVKERVKSKVYAVLTPEQRAKADAIIERMESRFEKGFASRS